MAYYDDKTPNVVALRDVVTALQGVSASMQEAMGAQRLPGSGTYAFRRITDPLQVPVAATATQFDVPATFFAEGGAGYQTTTFLVVNPNACYVRLRGTTSGPFRPVTPKMGWLFPPAFVGAFSTQYPIFMSAMAVPMPGVPLPTEFAPLDLIYGGGT
ncbi:hypothetical protein ASG40_11625 [Methylobacterium sp. Leaf399]|uniref:hypothetical protein n=1 Tax=Methylobacterium sp. Leaf399 TaxID=1736364 RepID=UPI0007008ECC|nr:hypothetical protein [Methylobacterium sp. Leaf399]KQT08521.1 hypothetical protein ASG40_11625 [Methylobacterium sp. Leaf399]